MLMLISIFFPILSGLALLLSKTENRSLRERWVIGSAVVTAVLGIAAVLTGYGDALTLVRFAENVELVLRPDGLGSVFAVMVSVLWVIASFYALEYMKHEGAETRFFGFFLASFGVTLGVAFSANILTMYLFYELLTLATLPLVMHAMNGKARYAGKTYILYSMTGAGLGFIAMVFLMYYGGGSFVYGGSLALEGLEHSRNMVLLAYDIGFFGFGVNAAIIPFHGWLLDASVAPTPVTALLHAVAVVKSGVFAVMRLTYFGFGADVLFGTWAQTVVVCAAAFTLVYGSANGLRAPHFKRRLAYSTVSNLSYILVGVGMMSPAGLVAAVAHMLFHAVNKITLFFGCGAVYYKTHKEYIYELSYIAKEMPVVMATFAVTALSLMGVPPLCGFTSKWLLGTAAMGTGLWLGWVAAGALILSALLTAMYMMSILFAAYAPAFRKGEIDNHDPNWLMKGPLVALAVLCVTVSLLAQPLLALVTKLLGV